MWYGGLRHGISHRAYLELLIGTLVLIILLLILTYVIQRIRQYRRSWNFQATTKTPKRPIWMFKYDLANIRKTDHAHFSIYTKAFKRKMCRDKKTNGWKDKSKKVTPYLREILEKYFDFSVNADMIPDSTCIISIPMKNFKSSFGIPGDFDAVHGGGLDEGFYEYQMIGHDRIQVAYFVSGDERFVAGICIYIENPYQEEFQYRESIILDLLNSPIYWSKSGEEHLDISSKYTLLTKNRYGEMNQFQFNGEARKFEVVDETGDFKPEEPKTKLEDLTVELCKSRNQLVNIGKSRDGTRMHAVWNEMSRSVDLVECASCAEPDAPPPEYRDLVNLE